MTPATSSQWILLLGYGVLLLSAVYVGGVRPRLRPLMFAIGFLALTHTAYYTAFLIFPELLDGRQTMNFSIAIRYQVLFTAALVFLLAVLRDRGRP